MSSPTRQLGDVLVVFDGPRRVRWNSARGVGVTPVALWPDSAQLCHVQHHIAQQRPLLVVVDYDQSPIPLLPEEIAVSPTALAPLLKDDGELTDLHIPLLDWLPAPLRARGEAFLRLARARRAAIPRPLLPDLVLEEQPAGPLRIALRTSARPLAEHDLTSIVEHVFGPYAQQSPAEPTAPQAPDAATDEPITTGART